MRGVGGTRDGGLSRPAWPVWCGAVAAFVGAGLLVVGALWLVISSGSAGTSYPSRLAAPIGVGLTTASLFGLYALLRWSRSRAGLLWGTVGAVVAVAALAALPWISAYLPPLASPGEASGPIPLLTVSALLVWWIRPLGIMVFGVAAMLAGLKGPWEYVLFAIGLLETPLPALALLYLTGRTAAAGWQMLMFGVPGVQTGLVGALAWLVLAGALYASWHELRRRTSGGRREGAPLP